MCGLFESSLPIAFLHSCKGVGGKIHAIALAESDVNHDVAARRLQMSFVSTACDRGLHIKSFNVAICRIGRRFTDIPGVIGA